MKILCILNSLNLPGSNRNKEQLFPPVLEMHADIGETSVLALDAPVWQRSARRLFVEGVRSLDCQPVMASWIPAKRLGDAIRQCSEDGMLRLFARKALQVNGALGWVSENGAPDAICALQGGSRSSYCAYLLSRLYDVPFVVWEHKTGYQRNLISGERADLRKRILRSASQVMAVSPQLAETMTSSLDIPDLNVSVIPNPAPDAIFEPAVGGPSFPVPDDGAFVFAAWTNWRSFKRIDVLLEAFEIVGKRGYDARLLIAGSGEEAHQLAEGRDRVTWIGQLDRAGIKALADACDCCVISSDFETFGLPAIEAMASGRPVVATICGGPESVVTNDSLGRTVAKGDAEKLASAMIEVLENRGSFDPQHIREYCFSTFSTAVLKERWKSVYEDAV